MTNNRITLWIKIIGWSVLIHIILIALSFLEVFIYSLLINPGQEESYYMKHAEQSAPYVSIIFGIVMFFLIARLLTKKRPHNWLVIGLALPIVYIVLDLIMLLPYEVNWGESYLIFIISFGTKALAGFIGARTARQ